MQHQWQAEDILTLVRLPACPEPNIETPTPALHARDVISQIPCSTDIEARHGIAWGHSQMPTKEGVL